RSQLLRDDPKLEAAGVSDQAHITGGARGDHVRKIQRALNQLDGARLSVDGDYGVATARAVLAYKQKRNIVNRSYQTTADDIVGKMTIAALDTELLAHENVPGALVPLNSAPIFVPVTARGPILAFGLSGSSVASTSGGSVLTVGAPLPGLVDLVPA